ARPDRVRDRPGKPDPRTRGVKPSVLQIRPRSRRNRRAQKRLAGEHESGPATSYALNAVQERGRLMVLPGDQIYAGMIVGQNARENDIPVNPCKAKKLTNMRSQGDGKGIQLNAPLQLSLERALEYIGHDEYVEATPHHLRLRKKILDETQRKRAVQNRAVKVAAE